VGGESTRKPERGDDRRRAMERDASAYLERLLDVNSARVDCEDFHSAVRCDVTDKRSQFDFSATPGKSERWCARAHRHYITSRRC